MKKNLSLRFFGTAIAMCLTIPTLADEGQGGRKIVSVEDVQVESPVGTVPRLPYQLWVTYSDHTGEFRQVKWMNSALATEQEMADAQELMSDPEMKELCQETYTEAKEKTEQLYQELQILLLQVRRLKLVLEILQSFLCLLGCRCQAYLSGNSRHAGICTKRIAEEYDWLLLQLQSFPLRRRSWQLS